MFFEKTLHGYIIRVRLTPNSSSCRTNGLINNSQGDSFLKINVTAIPEKGKANKALIEFLADRLKISKSAIEIIGGETGHWKRISITSKVTLENLFLDLAKEIT